MNESPSAAARTPGVFAKSAWHFCTRWAKLKPSPRAVLGDAAIWVILSAGLKKRSIYTPNCLKCSSASLGGPLKIMWPSERKMMRSKEKKIFVKDYRLSE